MPKTAKSAKVAKAHKAAHKAAKSKGVKPVPEGFRTVTAYLVVRDANAAIEFYGKAFGAKERFRHAMPDGRIGHAEVQIGDSIVMLADEFPEKGCAAPAAGTRPPVAFYVYVPDCDKVFQTATDAGAAALQPLMDMFWGDRYGTLQDPFGHVWSIATHKRDVSPEEMEEAAKKAFSQPQPAQA